MTETDRTSLASTQAGILVLVFSGVDPKLLSLLTAIYLDAQILDHKNRFWRVLQLFPGMMRCASIVVTTLYMIPQGYRVLRQHSHHRQSSKPMNPIPTRTCSPGILCKSSASLFDDGLVTISTLHVAPCGHFNWRST